MKYFLKKRPRRCIIIEGYPGYGLIGSIVTNYLIDNLKMEMIGSFFSEKIPPLVPIHKGKLLSPFGIYYSKELNILISQVVVASPTIEWDYTNSVLKLAKDINAKQIVTIEGIGNVRGINPEKPKVYAFSNKKEEIEKIKKLKIPFMKEGMIMGPTAGLLISSDNIPVIGFFAEAIANMPDSRAAAAIIKTLDQYYNLKIDYEPLLEEAEKFETIIKEIIRSTQQAQKEKEKKQLDYFG